MEAFRFQSTLPARGATHAHIVFLLLTSISIHAPRTGSDVLEADALTIEVTISIHAPRTGSDAAARMNRHFIGFISIHAPRTGSDVGARVKRDFTAISIHAPRTGSDRRKAMYNIIVYEFQSTLPARGATASKRYPQRNRGDFNPRSPHGERRRRRLSAADAGHFNPRSPHGERLATAAVLLAHIVFQSTLPARGAT